MISFSAENSVLSARKSRIAGRLVFGFVSEHRSTCALSPYVFWLGVEMRILFFKIAVVALFLAAAYSQGLKDGREESDAATGFAIIDSYSPFYNE